MAETDFDKTLILWAQNTLDRIRKNFETQRVSPHKPYDDAPESTKDAYRSLYWAVHNNASGDEFKISFFFNYYLIFVDAGVGRGHKYKYDNDAPLNYLLRYKEWPTKPGKDGKRRGAGRVSRPILNAEVRHQVRRLHNILMSEYDRDVQLAIIYGLSNMIKPNGTIDLSIDNAIINEKNKSKGAIRTMLDNIDI